MSMPDEIRRSEEETIPVTRLLSRIAEGILALLRGPQAKPAASMPADDPVIRSLDAARARLGIQKERRHA